MARFRNIIIFILPISLLYTVSATEPISEEEEKLCLQGLYQTVGPECISDGKGDLTLIYQFSMRSEAFVYIRNESNCRKFYYHFMSEHPKCFPNTED